MMEQYSIKNLTISRSMCGYQHILFIAGYIKHCTTTIIPEDVIILLWFFYAKPIKMSFNYKTSTKHILYCHLDDTFISVLAKIEQQFNTKFNTLQYGGTYIEPEKWCSFELEENMKFIPGYNDKIILCVCPRCAYVVIKDYGMHNIKRCGKCLIWFNTRTKDMDSTPRELKKRSRKENTLWDPGMREYIMKLQRDDPTAYNALYDVHFHLSFA
eukprot:363959_1